MEIVMLVVFIILVYVVLKTVADYRYNKLESEVLKNLGFSNWNIIANIDAYVAVKSRQTLEKYDDIKFFKENKEKFHFNYEILDWDKATEHLPPIDMEAFMKALADPNFGK